MEFGVMLIVFGGVSLDFATTNDGSQRVFPFSPSDGWHLDLSVRRVNLKRAVW